MEIPFDLFLFHILIADLEGFSKHYIESRKSQLSVPTNFRKSNVPLFSFNGAYTNKISVDTS